MTVDEGATLKVDVAVRYFKNSHGHMALNKCSLKQSVQKVISLN